MPTVPTSNVVPLRQQGEAAAPSPTMLAMAAAMMHSEGKLGSPQPKKSDGNRDK